MPGCGSATARGPKEDGDGYTRVALFGEFEYVNLATGGTINMGCTWHPDEAGDEEPRVVDLSHPDTRAAFDRRLAIRLAPLILVVGDDDLIERCLAWHRTE